jgi:hypothetical protein
LDRSVPFQQNITQIEDLLLSQFFLQNIFIKMAEFAEVVESPLNLIVSPALLCSPRALIKNILESQGHEDQYLFIDWAERDIKEVVDKIVDLIDRDMVADGKDSFHCFLSYRESNSPQSSAMAKAIYEALKGHADGPIHAFYAPKCLKNGKPWREGFLSAVKKCKVFIPILTGETFAFLIDSQEERPNDSVLVEYQEALKNKTRHGEAMSIFPVMLTSFDVSAKEHLSRMVLQAMHNLHRKKGCQLSVSSM